MVKFPPIRALYCNHPFAVHLVKNKDVYFDGFQSDIFNSFVPKKIFNITFTESRDCFLGIRTENNSFNGMLGQLQRSKIDIAIVFARQNNIVNEFFLSPTISTENANFYYFLKMNLKWANILSSVKTINYDICLLFIAFILVSTFVYLIRFKRLAFMSKINLLSDLFFRLIQLMLQRSAKDQKMSTFKNDHMKHGFKQMTKKNFHLVDPRLSLMFNIFITFFFLNYFLASINNSFIELDKSEFLNTIDDLALHPDIFPVLSKNGNLQAYYNNSKDSINQRIWQKMVKRGLDKSLIHIKAGDISAMINCLTMLKKNRLAYIVNRYGMTLVISGYCSTLYRSHKDNQHDQQNVMWLSKLFAPMLISIPYNLNIDFKLKRSLDKHFDTFLTYGFTVNLDEKVLLKLREHVETTNSQCVINERKEVIDAERHSSLIFENFLYAFWLLFLLDFISVVVFIVHEKVLKCYIIRKRLLFYFHFCLNLLTCFFFKTARVTKKVLSKSKLIVYKVFRACTGNTH